LRRARWQFTGLLLGLLLSIGLLPLTTSTAQDDSAAAISYGQTRSALISTEDPLQRWAFDGQAGDILRATATRIGGQIVPELRLLSPEGNVIAAAPPPIQRDAGLMAEASLRVAVGLPADGTYILEARSSAPLDFNPANPDEIALTLSRGGQYRGDLLEQLPAVGLEPIPPLEAGEVEVSRFGINVYGAPTIAPPSPQQPNVYTIERGQQRVIVDNNVPLTQGVRSITLLQQGAGLVLAHNDLPQGEALFYTNQEVRVAYAAGSATYTFTLASGQRIVTDLYRISSIQAIDGIVAVRLFHTEEDGTTTERRALFDSELIDLRRIVLAPNVTPQNRFVLDDGSYVQTDNAGWTTLAVLDGELQVLYGGAAPFLFAEGRFITDDVRVDALLLENGQSLIQHAANSDSQLSFRIDWELMGDVRLRDRQLSVTPLDGRQLSQPAETVESLLIEAGAVRYALRDMGYLLSLPDGTLIEADTPPEAVPLALPGQPGFVPAGFNNLGNHLLSTCSCLLDHFDVQPVNPANGNFHASVTDVYVPSHALPLEFTRHYNSHADALTPPALTADPATYPVGVLGDGWRHSLQIDLDIRWASLGQVRLILPDGSQHLFTLALADETAPTFLGRSLPGWTLRRIGSIVGTWEATDPQGRRYSFDRAGRLERIWQGDTALIMVPAPLDYLEAGQERGVFVVEPYGRRMELYTDAAGRVVSVRDPLLTTTRFAYDDAGRLIGAVQNGTSATYAYDAEGRLRRYDDIRLTHAPTAQLIYDGVGRVTRLVFAPDAEPHALNYSYDDADLTTRRTMQVEGVRHEDRWSFALDARDGWLLVERAAGTPDQVYQYAYINGRLSGLRLPNLTRYNYTTDARGNVTEIEDPFGIYAPYRLSYVTRGDVQLLSEIAYPNDALTQFVYDDAGRLIARRQRVRLEPETFRETRFTYDALGRVALRIDPGTPPVATAYRYDAYGYVSEIWEGIAYDEDTDPASITAEQAARVLRLSHDLLGRLRALTDASGRTWAINWQGDQPTAIILPDGGTLSYQYDAAGRLLRVDDRGQVTTYDYDPLGYLASRTDALGQQTLYDYDPLGQLRQITDDTGRVTAYTYDALGELTQIIAPGNRITTLQTLEEPPPSSRRQRVLTDAAGRTLSWRYDAAGRLVQVTLRDGDIVQSYTLEVNATGLPTRIQRTNGRAISYSYNRFGDVTATRIGDLETRYEYDEAGRVAAIALPDDTRITTTYDRLGRLTRVSLPDDLQVEYGYDADGRLLSYTDATGATTVYEYDEAGRLTAVIDPEGQRTSVTYNERGLLVSLSDPLGSQRNFSYDALGNLVTRVDGIGQETTYSYDALSRLIAIDDNAQGRNTLFAYNTSGQIRAIRRYNDRIRSLYSYDALGRLTSVTDPLGYTTTLRYNGLGEVSRVTDPLGNEQRFEWLAGLYALSSLTDPAGNVINTANLDPLGRLQRWLDTTTPEAQALNQRYQYDIMGSVTQAQTFNLLATSEQVVTWRYTYDAAGRVTGAVDPEGGVWELRYDGEGRLLSVTEPGGRTTELDYNANGQPIEITYAAGTADAATESYAYDAAGNLVRYTSPTGTVTVYDYDANNRLIAVTEGLGTAEARLIRYDYNGLGQLQRVIAPGGQTTSYRYSLDQPAQVRRVAGDLEIAAFYDYDLNGNLTSVRLPHILGEETPFTINLAYNALGQRVRATDPSGNVWAYTYDEAGNLAQVSDPLGSTTAYDYDAYNRLVTQTTPTGAQTRYAYDRTGYLDRITLSGGAVGALNIDYDFDLNGNLLSARLDEDDGLRLTYDAAGRPLTITWPDGSSFGLVYDAAGQLVERRLLGTEEVQRYDYDAAGRLTAISAGDEAIIYAYDVLGRLTSVTETQGDEVISELLYEYDAADRLTLRDVGDLGATAYSYDALGRLTRMEFGPYSVDLAYNARGQITEINRSNGVTSFYGYDGSGRRVLVQHFDPDDERLGRYDYGYDAVGNLVRVDRAGDTGGSILYSYDVAHRLIGERWLDASGAPQYTLSLRYDDAGHRTESARNGQRLRYEYDERGRLIALRAGGSVPDDGGLALAWVVLALVAGVTLRRRRFMLLTTLAALLLAGVVLAAPPPMFPSQVGDAAPEVLYTYDENDNLVTITTGESQLDLRYDPYQRLSALSDPVSGDETLLRYDLAGRLVGWGLERLIYDGDVPIGRINPAGAERYLSLPDGERLLTLGADGRVLWHLNDGSGTTRRYTDADGVLLDDPALNWDYGAFGEIVAGELSAGRPNFGLRGQIVEPATGLYLTQPRAYDPQTARTLQPLPLWIDPTTGRYDVPEQLAGEVTLLTADMLPPINPGTSLPRPQLPVLPMPPATRELQTAEMLRPLALLSPLLTLNDVVALVPPETGELYLYSLRPAPSEVLQSRADSALALLALAADGDWRPDLQPDVSLSADAPLTTLDALTGLVPGRPDERDWQYRTELRLNALLEPIQPQFAFLPSAAFPPRVTVDALDGLPLQPTRFSPAALDEQPHVPNALDTIGRQLDGWQP